VRIVGVTRTQDHSQRKTILPIKNEERMIHVFSPIAVEKAQWLPAVGRLVGTVWINNQHFPTAGVGRQIQIQQGLG